MRSNGDVNYGHVGGNSYGKRSPLTDWDDGAYLVYPSGGVVYNFSFSYYVSYSYGRILRSPNTDWGDRAYFVYPDGDVDSGYSYVNRSYGVLSPDIRYTSFWWVDISGTLDSYLHNDVSYYCGNFSPYTAGISIWNIYPDGTIIGNHDGYFLFLR